MKHKLIVISFDSMFDEDIPFLKGLPNFGRLLKRATIAKGGMRSIYPTLTYPVHVSMITGTYPERHGIFHNERLRPEERTSDWYWYREDIKAETLVDAAHAAGLTTACLGWPVMGGDSSADWLVPEIWTTSKTPPLEEVLQRSASASVLAEDGSLNRYMHIFERQDRVFLDETMVSCACDLIRRKQPDFMCMHVANLDHVRHAYGLQASTVEQALIMNDDWLGRIIDATIDAGTYGDTNFAVISDHGQLSVSRMFQPNVLFERAGLIEIDDDDCVVNWKAYCFSAALSCQVYLKDPKDVETRALVEELLDKMVQTQEYGVEAMFTKEEVKREQHLDGDFSYVLEGRMGTSFGDACTGPVVVQPDNSDYKFSIASHGHLPHKGAQPVFFMAGPDILENHVIPRQRIIDEAPTFAKLLGVELPMAQGRCLTEILV